MILSLIENVNNFEKYSFEDKKNIIHIVENSLRSGSFDISSEELKGYIFSTDILYRIIYYLEREFRSAIDFDHDIENLRIELEKINAATAKLSISPIHYCIRQIKKGIIFHKSSGFDVVQFEDTLHFFRGRKDLDVNNKIKHNLEFIIKSSRQGEISVIETTHLQASLNLAIDLIAKGKSLKAIRLLLDGLQNNDTIRMKVVLISNQINQLELAYLKGLLLPGEYNQESNKIVGTLIEFIKAYKQPSYGKPE